MRWRVAQASLWTVREGVEGEREDRECTIGEERERQSPSDTEFAKQPLSRCWASRKDLWSQTNLGFPASHLCLPHLPQTAMGIQGMELFAMGVVIILFVAVLKQFGILEPMSLEGKAGGFVG
ncbi:calsenilin-like [Arapaima gigas]